MDKLETAEIIRLRRADIEDGWPAKLARRLAEPGGLWRPTHAEGGEPAAPSRPAGAPGGYSGHAPLDDLTAPLPTKIKHCAWRSPPPSPPYFTRAALCRRLCRLVSLSTTTRLALGALRSGHATTRVSAQACMSLATSAILTHMAVMSSL